MKIQMIQIKKLAVTIAFASTFALFGCQKQEDVQTLDAADQASQAAQAAQAATDAAYAAVPTVDEASSAAIETANNAAVSNSVLTIAAS